MGIGRRIGHFVASDLAILFVAGFVDYQFRIVGQDYQTRAGADNGCETAAAARACVGPGRP